jgi:hypothetical protein
MSITTYAELKTKVSDQIDRDDLTDAVVSDFVSLAESAMKRDLFTMSGEVVATYVTVAGENRVPVPNDYIGIRSIHVRGDTGSVLRLVSVDKLNASYAATTQGSPIMFSIVGDYFVLSPTPDSTYTLELTYYGFSELSDTNTSNWILQKHPDLYLTGALFEAGDYIMDNEKLAKYKSRYEAIITDINERDKAERYGTDFRSRPYGLSVV